MAATPETLPRHELVGLPAEVVDSTDPSKVGIAGDVVAETTKTLAIESDERVRHVPKAEATFAFRLRGGEDAEALADSSDVAGAANAADTAEGDVVEVDGAVLVARPARRSERTGDSKWR